MAINVRVETDAKVDALYIYLSEKPVKYSKELNEDIAVDFAEDNTPVGIDVQRASEVFREVQSKKGRRLPEKSVRSKRAVGVELVMA